MKLDKSAQNEVKQKMSSNVVGLGISNPFFQLGGRLKWPCLIVEVFGSRFQCAKRVVVERNDQHLMAHEIRDYESGADFCRL